MSDAAAPAPAEAPSTPAPPDADADMTDAPPSEAPAPAAPEEEVDEATRERLRALDGLRAKIAEHKEVEAKLKEARASTKDLVKEFEDTENALNALLHGRKRWWLKEPSEAVYSVRHPRAWCRRGVEVAFTLECCVHYHQHAIDATRNRSVATQDGRR